VPGLIAHVGDPDPNVRVAVAEALGRLGGEPACRALEGLLTSNEPLLRVCALDGLTDQRAPPPLPMFAGLLKDAWTRTSAFRLLGLVEHPTAWGLVCRALSSPATRDAALGALGARSGLPGPQLEREVSAVLHAQPDVVPWLSHALDSDAADRRQGALVAALILGEPLLAFPVARAVRPGPESELAMAVLLRLGTRGASLLLSGKGALADLSAPARALVAEAVIRLAEPSLIIQLGVLLQSDEPELRALASRALGRTRSPDAIPLLLACLEDPALLAHAARSMVSLAVSWPLEVREALAPLMLQEPLEPAMVRAWAEVAKGDAAEVLERAALSQDEGVREAAVDSAPLAPFVAPRVLVGALGDASAAVRRAATRALRCIDRMSARPSLAQALSDTDPSVLALAAAAAAELRADEFVPVIEALTRHPSSEVVRAALSALGLLDALSDEVLREAAARGDPEVEKHVFALGAERPEVVARAVDRLAHARADVRLAAARVMLVSAGPAERDAILKARDKEIHLPAKACLDLALTRIDRMRKEL
jgi:HEAT repeat protein